MYASPVAGDLDGDGQLEIAVGSDADSQHGMNIALYDHEGELEPGWPVAFGDTEVRSIAADIGAGDLDGDGQLDVVSSYDAIGFGVFHGNGAPFPTHESFTDRVITAVEAYHELTLSQQGWGSGDRSEFTYSPPTIADIDADGDLEIVLAGDHEHSDSTANQGVTLWVLNHDITRPAGWDPPKDTGAPLDTDSLSHNMVRTCPAPAVGNLDGHAGLEIVFPAYDGNVYCYGSDGTEQWRYSVMTAAPPYVDASEALLVDLNGDAVPEVVFTSYSSGEPGDADTTTHLVVLSATGEQLHEVALHARGSMAAPAVADLDGDGQLELVISLKDTLGGGDGGVQLPLARLGLG